MRRLIISILVSLGIHALFISLDTSWFNIMPSPRPHPTLTTISLIALPPRGEKKAESTKKPSGKVEKKARVLPDRQPSPPKPMVRQKPQIPEKPAIPPVKQDSPPKAVEERAAVKKDAPEIPKKPKKSLKKITKKPRKAVQTKLVEKVDPPEIAEQQSKIEPPADSSKDLGPQKSPPDPSDAPAPLPPQNIPGKDALTESDAGKQSTAVATKGDPSIDSGLIMARPLYRKNPPPRYPRRARKKGYEGMVILEVLVDQKGLVKDLKVFQSSGYEILDQSALESVQKWIFEPGARNGKAIKMWVRVPIRFKLN